MDDREKSLVIRLVTLAAMLILTLVVGCSTVGTVPSGSVGVVTRFGATTGELKQPGLYAVVPFVSGVERMDTQTHAYKATATAASKDLQDVTTEVTLNFRLMPQGAVRMFNEMRRDYGSRILVPSVQEAIKAVTARFTAEELISKRADVRNGIEAALRERLASHNIEMEQASITNFQFSPEFAQAVEDKVVAQQNALAAENRVKQAKFTADSVIETARGQAEAIRIQSEAITKQGGAEYVQLRAIEKWNGTLPTWMSGNGSVPFVNVGTPK